MCDLSSKRWLCHKYWWQISYYPACMGQIHNLPTFFLAPNGNIKNPWLQLRATCWLHGFQPLPFTCKWQRKSWDLLIKCHHLLTSLPFVYLITPTTLTNTTNCNYREVFFTPRLQPWGKPTNLVVTVFIVTWPTGTTYCWRWAPAHALSNHMGIQTSGGCLYKTDEWNERSFLMGKSLVINTMPGVALFQQLQFRLLFCLVGRVELLSGTLHLFMWTWQ